MVKKDKKDEKVVEEVPVVAEAKDSHEGKRKVWRHGGYVWEGL